MFDVYKFKFGLDLEINQENEEPMLHNHVKHIHTAYLRSLLIHYFLCQHTYDANNDESCSDGGVHAFRVAIADK